MTKPATYILCACLILLVSCRPGPTAALTSPSPTHTAQPALEKPTSTSSPAPSSEPSATPPPSSTPPPTFTPTPSGITVALDPGHGGEDLGGRHWNRQGEMDLHESTVTLDLAKRIGAKLQAAGYRVFLTRDGDYDPNPYEKDSNGDGEINLRDVVQTRIDMINASGADLQLSLHINDWESDDEELLRSTGGVETYYCPDRPFGDRNLRLAQLVHENLLTTLGKLGDVVSDRGVRIDHEKAYPGDPGRHLMILGPEDDIIKRATNMPGILSEPLFIQCDREAALMQDPAAMDALAQAYADAIVAYFREFPKQ